MPNYAVNQPLYSGSSYPQSPYLYPLMQSGYGELSTLIYPMFMGNTYSVLTSYGLGSLTLYATAANTTNVVDVSDYNNFAFQPDVSGSSGTQVSYFTVSSSIDGWNWVGDFSIAVATSASAVILRFPTSGSTSNRRRYLLATHSGSNGATGSLYLLAGQ